MLNRLFNIKPIIFSIFLFSALLLCSCATTGKASFSDATEIKNSLPFVEKELLSEVHSVVIAPFYDDKDNWNQTALEIMSSSGRISVIQPVKIDSFLKDNKNLSDIKPEDRAAVLGYAGMSLNADAVLNGIVLKKEDRQEIILQLISSHDSRVLWWQAIEFGSKENPISAYDRNKLLNKALSPLIDHLAKKEKRRDTPPAVQEIQAIPNAEIVPSAESLPKVEPQPKNIIKPKSDRKGIRPGSTTDAISPM